MSKSTHDGYEGPIPGALKRMRVDGEEGQRQMNTTALDSPPGDSSSRANKIQARQADLTPQGGDTVRKSARKSPKDIPPEKVTVAIFCALAEESVAVRRSLDEKLNCRHETIGPRTYIYSFGRIGDHIVVIARPTQMGPVSAASCAATVHQQFPSIRFALMVGIAAGIPSLPERDIRLGDVAVSIPRGSHPGVLQYDFGKYEQDEQFVLKGTLNKPPPILINADGSLEEDEMMDESLLWELLEDITKHRGYARSDSRDILFDPTFHHVNNGDDCSGCEASDEKIVVSRPEREGDRGQGPLVHRGLILSGGGVIKNPKDRTRFCRGQKDAICFEMEAAGIADEIPCLVVRGICDYADTHKQDSWHHYAAAVAAAYAKAILLKFESPEVEEMVTMGEMMPEIQKMNQGLHDLNKTINNYHEEQTLADEHKKILDWLTPVSYDDQQRRYFETRQPGTGQWLLDSEEFQGWLETSKQTLFCHGYPGAGKTILTSIVINHLHANIQKPSKPCQEDNVAIAFVYCDFKQQDKQKPVDILTSLLKQLIGKLPSAPETIKRLYEKYRSNTPASCPITDISNALQSVVSVFARVFIVIDALDECQDSKAVLDEVFKLQNTGANVFATSRPKKDIQQNFQECVQLEIRAMDEDLKKYIDGRTSDLDILEEEDEAVKEDIRSKIEGNITKAVDGIFLLARFHLDSLTGKTTRNQILDELKTLPRGPHAYDQAYGKTIKRIRTQAPPRRCLARRALMFLTCAERHLTTKELEHALGVKPGQSALDQGDITSHNIVVSVCMGLVTVENGRDIIRLLHHTTLEYLQHNMGCIPFLEQPTLEDTTIFGDKENETARTEAQREITAICVTYLSFSIFESGFCSSDEVDEVLEEQLRLNPFYRYAASNWGHHARKALSLCQMVMDFLKCETKVEASSQVLMPEIRLDVYNDNLAAMQKTTGLHLASYFGIGMAVDAILLDHHSDPKDNLDRTPLSLATENGHEAVARALLEKGGDTESRDNLGRTPLLLAAENGYKEVVRALMQGSLYFH